MDFPANIVSRQGGYWLEFLVDISKMDTKDIRQYHGHFKHDFESAFANDEDGEDGFEWCLYDFRIVSTKPFVFIADRMKFIPYLERKR